MKDPVINPISIIVGYWMIYIIFLSIILILAIKSDSIVNLLKTTEDTKQKMSKGIRIFAMILLALLVVEITYFFIDTVGYLSNKKEYPKYHTCKLKKVKSYKGIIRTEILFICEDNKLFRVDNNLDPKLSWDEISTILTSYRRTHISSYSIDDSEKIFAKFTILPKTGIIINVQPLDTSEYKKATFGEIGEKAQT